MKQKIAIEVTHPTHYESIFNALMVCEVSFFYNAEDGSIVVDILRNELVEILESEKVAADAYTLKEIKL